MQGCSTRSERAELLPNREPGRILVNEILDAVRKPAVPELWPAGTWPTAVSTLVADLDRGVAQALAGRTLAGMAGGSSASAAGDGHPVQED